MSKCTVEIVEYKEWTAEQYRNHIFTFIPAPSSPPQYNIGDVVEIVCTGGSRKYVVIRGVEAIPDTVGGVMYSGLWLKLNTVAAVSFIEKDILRGIK